MRTPLQKLGTAQGVLIPPDFLAACHLKDEVEMHLEDGRIVIEPVLRPRQGWAEAAAAIAQAGEVPLDEVETEADQDWVW